MKPFIPLHPVMLRFAKDKGGASAIIFALSLPVFVGFVGLGTEAGLWYLTERRVQSAADMAAYTGALEYRSGAIFSTINTEAEIAATDNGYDNSSATLTVTTVGKDTVRAVIVEEQPRLFSGVFMKTATQSITVEAEATFESGGPACVLALSSIEFDALTFTGNTDVDLKDCNIMSNSSASQSILQTGSSTVSADCVYAAGGISHNSNMTTTNCSSPVENAQPSADPYAHLNVPASPAACTAIPKFKPTTNFTLSPGRYCGDMVLKGDVTFSPGTYIIDGGDLEATSQARVSGTDVTIVMTGGGEIKINGGAELNLSAPSSGYFSGVLFYQDRNDSGYQHVINGNSSSSFDGAMYFPSSEVKMLGSGAATGGCLQLIADTIYFSGTSSFEHNCATSGTTQIDIVGGVSLTL